MVKLIMGGKGTGKTKTIIDLVNTAVAEEKGAVVCIAKGNKLTFDISHDARLVDVSDYAVKGYAGLLGFLSGIHAGNYDISQFYIDSLYKIVDDEKPENAEKFLRELDAFAEKHSVKFTVAISEDERTATEVMKKFM
ncbi:MAG: hypothetical protein AB7C89_05295 [Intestinibacillus sp.]